MSEIYDITVYVYGRVSLVIITSVDVAVVLTIRGGSWPDGVSGIVKMRGGPLKPKRTKNGRVLCFRDTEKAGDGMAAGMHCT